MTRRHLDQRALKFGSFGRTPRFVDSRVGKTQTLLRTVAVTPKAVAMLSSPSPLSPSAAKARNWSSGRSSGTVAL